MTPKIEKILNHKFSIPIILGFSFVLMVKYIILNQDCEGGEDNMSLYTRSRFGLYHPIAFFREPIKILFAMIMSLPAQLGFKAVQIVNALLACLSAWFAVKIIYKMELKNAWIAILITLFSPMYFLISLTVLSEIMFSFFLISSVLLIYNKKYVWAAIILSFSPYIRSEGFVLMLIFIIYFILEKQWKALPWLILGTLFFSISGYSYHNDIMWVFHKNYGDASGLYGHGEWYDFIKGSKLYNSPILNIMLPLALVVAVYKLKYLLTQQRNFIILIMGCYFGFLLLHSYLWWQGKGGSLGLIRVMACVAPLSGIIAVWLLSQSEKYMKGLQVYLYIFIALGSVYFCFNINRFPIGLDGEHTVVAKLYKLSIPYLEKAPEIKFNSTYFAFLAGIDPYDYEKGGDCLTVNKEVLDSMKPGSLVQYETHFGPNECQTDTDFYDKHRPDFEKVLEVYPDERFKVLNGYEYKNVLYRKK
ncbi:MAG: hypothetical protein SGJ10_05590 [Bacteroidota bacterium]|nr:hypothetical protein [Bacteroidota bacterium]